MSSRAGLIAKGEFNNISFDSASVGGHIIPSAHETYDIGSASYKIRDMFVSDNSLWIGDTHKISIQTGKMKFRKRKSSTVPTGVLSAGGNSAAALSYAGKGSLELMTTGEWLSYRQTFNPEAKITDVFADADFDDETEDMALYYTKSQVDSIITALKGTASTAFDTLGELESGIDANELTVVNNAAAIVAAQAAIITNHP
jgi:alkanesulfonate monooxygenase SsuD/methylene tetrahydromethanopterin reductase-like flavin-dependent oxidoreductase (luciferase family)